MTHTATEYVGVLEQIGRLALRPHLKIWHGGPRAIEIVAIHYPAGRYSSFDSPGSTATVQRHGTYEGRSRYIRAWVYNDWGFPARRVEVYVDRISLDGQVIEGERSPLHWADFAETFEYPKPMRRGYKNGGYIDICAADSIDPRLQILTLKGLKRGYHRFDKAGTYTIFLCAEGTPPCSFAYLTLTVSHDAKDWKNLTVVSAM